MKSAIILNILSSYKSIKKKHLFSIRISTTVEIKGKDVNWLLTN